MLQAASQASNYFPDAGEGLRGGVTRSEAGMKDRQPPGFSSADNGALHVVLAAGPDEGSGTASRSLLILLELLQIGTRIRHFFCRVGLMLLSTLKMEDRIQ